MDVSRGEIYMVCLDPVFGREIGGFKMRPVVIVSINDINKRTRLVTVVPGTSDKPVTDKTGKPGIPPYWWTEFQNVVTVDTGDGSSGLREKTHFECHQVRAIERGRLTAKSIGKLSREDFERIEKSLAYCLGLDSPTLRTPVADR